MSDEQADRLIKAVESVGCAIMLMIGLLIAAIFLVWWR